MTKDKVQESNLCHKNFDVLRYPIEGLIGTCSNYKLKGMPLSIVHIRKNVFYDFTQIKQFLGFLHWKCEAIIWAKKELKEKDVNDAQMIRWGERH